MNLPSLRPQPLFFASENRSLFGWLHRSTSVDGDLGLVICNPFGHEAQNCHRALRHWAESAASAGIPTLRFDFDGTGDSSGEDADANRVADWVASVHCAVETLRESTGVTRVAILGVRLGGLLATLAASERDDIAGLALIAPVATGKAWLREMRALHGALELGTPPADATPLPDGAREAMGFLLSVQTIADLTNVDLLKIQECPAPHILLLDRDDLPGIAKLEAHLSSLGAKVNAQTQPGYAAMMLDPHQSQVPSQMIEATTDWLCSLAESAPPAPINFEATTSAAISDKVQEHAVFLDEEQRLFGIVSAPRGEKPQKAILLINSGANHRTGPNRLHVKLARRWAARGYLVLRFDIAGIGDSLPHEGESEHVVYPSTAIEDVTLAAHYVRKTWQVKECRAVGLCSGGYHALKGALMGAPVDGVVLINPLTYCWRQGTSLEMPNSQVFAEAARYKQSVLKADKWKRLFRGEADISAVAQVVVRRGAGVAVKQARNAARRAGVPLRNDLSAALLNLTRRGVTLSFVFAEGDAGLPLLHEEAGPAVPRLEQAGQLTIHRIAGPDHTFTPLWSHEKLAASLDVALEANQGKSLTNFQNGQDAPRRNKLMAFFHHHENKIGLPAPDMGPRV